MQTPLSKWKSPKQDCSSTKNPRVMQLTNSQPCLNPFVPRMLLTKTVWMVGYFCKLFGIKPSESCWLCFDEKISFKCFVDDAFTRKISSKVSGFLGALWA